MLQCTNISKSFKRDFWAKEFIALRSINFELSQGKIVGFLGANGAGKTTLIKIILGFIRPDSGSINILNKDWLDESVHAQIGYMPERPFYYQNLTGLEFLEYCGKLQNINKNDLEKSIDKWTTKFRIKFALDRQIKGYSKGMLQRLGFASVLLHNPKLIILDEPLSGLDPVGRKEFKDVIREVNKDGVSVFFSSHIVSDVEEVCDDVVVLEDGVIVYNGPIKKLVEENTSNEFIIKYYNEDNLESLVVSSTDKDKKMYELLKQGMKIERIERVSSSLEEIIYRLNK
ncbi:ABC transporter, ATP-binding protein [Halobacteriovorax sp. BALOs_7]|uniref:ABC transporter ATP-binding protein n=1 Tax=unclassified Halobacteriovorax TaxID=2639665 RepID=UPI000EA3E7DA|nr:ABC transporter ATP-binding protein [Halobacteriovorax sp. BALOs_7]AYF43169.1 ABC transporter, ATP-binding protein [Halobacteriovorax sp. BALOs_7]